MSTRADRLVARIHGSDFKPRVGDVLRHPSRPGRHYIIHIGLRRSSAKSESVILANLRRGEWTILCFDYFQFMRESYRLVDTEWSGFIWGGFSPADTGRAYVLFKQDAGVILRAGCRRFTTFAQAARHWRAGNGSESWALKRDIAQALFQQARALGWLKVKRQPPVKKKIKPSSLKRVMKQAVRR